MKRTLIAGLVALALFGSACSSGTNSAEEAQQAEDAREEAEKASKGGGKVAGKGGAGKTERGSGKGGGAGKAGNQPGDGDEVPGAPGAPGAEGVPGSTGDDSPTGLQPQGKGGAAFASKSAHYEEPSPDAEKDGPLSPGYAEATKLDVQGLGKDLRITFTFNGEVPQQMPTDKTYMIVAFALSGEKKGQEAYGINAQATDEGWQAALGAKDEAKQFPGTFFVRGNTVEFTLPWSAIGGPRPFEFYGSSSWFQYTAGVTSYSVDPIPNDKGTYPN